MDISIQVIRKVDPFMVNKIVSSLNKSFVVPRHVGSSWTRAQTRVPCIGRQILNHCATREDLNQSLMRLIRGYSSHTDKICNCRAKD